MSAVVQQVQSLVRDEARAKLTALYEQHRPEQAKFVDVLLKQCPQGGEAALLAKVRQKFARDPSGPPAKRPRPAAPPPPPPPGAELKANKYAVGDRVMVPLRSGGGGPEQQLWLPGEVMEAADPGRVLPSGGRYTVFSHEHCEPPNHRRRVIVFDEDVNSIRPEVCFQVTGRIGSVSGRKMAQHAAVTPVAGRHARGPWPGRAWRFAEGDRVACRVDTEGDGSGDVAWAAGAVAKVGSREAGSRVDSIAAYKVNIDRPGGTRLGSVHSVWAAQDAHWLIRPLAEQPPRPLATPSTAGLRYTTRPAREGGEVLPGRWERFDHATGHAEPAEEPEGDYDAGPDPFAAVAAAAADGDPFHQYRRV